MLRVRADARSTPLRSESVQCVVTSSPYFGLRQYGDHPDEIGRGTLKEFLDETLGWTREVKRILRPDGLFWFNIGDTASGSGGAGGDHNRGGSKAEITKYRQGESGVPPMQWCLVPQRVALLLQEDGWLVRKAVTWDKGQLRPENAAHVRRPRVASETILMLARTRGYRYDHTAETEPGDVWHFPPATGKRSHFAPYPEELPRRCIKVSTSPGDVVYDPFVGSGTTVAVANRMGRIGMGADLY